MFIRHSTCTPVLALHYYHGYNDVQYRFLATKRCVKPEGKHGQMMIKNVAINPLAEEDRYEDPKLLQQHEMKDQMGQYATHSRN